MRKLLPWLGFSWFLAGCAVQPIQLLTIPAPPGGLPHPYATAEFQVATAEQKAYAEYLMSTPLFPDEVNCANELLRRLNDSGAGGESGIKWVTRPYLAWGGIWNEGAVVGPVEHMYSITEAHVTWLDRTGSEQRATYSCFVQYARQEEPGVWRNGNLKYGANLETGHKQYVSFPARIYADAPPGLASEWEKEIRYYRPD